MKILFICNTYMQVIIALQAKMKLFADDDVDIVLSDHSLNADKRADGLRKTGLFRRVKYIETKTILKYSKLTKLFTYFSQFFMKNNVYSNLYWDDLDYDRIFFYNPGIDTFVAFDKALRFSGRKNPPETIRMEEGVLSIGWLPLVEYGLRYGDFSRREKFFHILCKLTGRPDLISNTHKYMCFYPELLGISPRMKNIKRKDYPNIRIPLLKSDKDFLDKLNTIFDYDPSANSFPQKYIYFSTSADIDGNPVGETEIILKLAELVGKDNLLVKIHPRDGRDVFERAGLTVSRNSSLPWEVIQLNHDFTKHIFISLSSGSTVNITAMKNENIPVFLLFPLVAGKNKFMDSLVYASIKRGLEELQALGICSSIKITDKLGDVIM